MLSNDFLENKYSYKVAKRQMPMFLRECEEHGLVWSHGEKAIDFNPIQFYAGENIKYLAPIQKVDSRDTVYIKCYYGRLYFSFCYNWSMQPQKEYRKGEK